MSKQLIDTRSNRAIKMIEDGIKPRKIDGVKRGTYFVASSNTNSSYGYLVTVNDCTCTDFRIRKQTCKHMFLVRFAK